MAGAAGPGPHLVEAPPAFIRTRRPFRCSVAGLRPGARVVALCYYAEAPRLTPVQAAGCKGPILENNVSVAADDGVAVFEAVQINQASASSSQAHRRFRLGFHTDGSEFPQPVSEPFATFSHSKVLQRLRSVSVVALAPTRWSRAGGHACILVGGPFIESPAFSVRFRVQPPPSAAAAGVGPFPAAASWLGGSPASAAGAAAAPPHSLGWPQLDEGEDATDRLLRAAVGEARLGSDAFDSAVVSRMATCPAGEMAYARPVDVVAASCRVLNKTVRCPSPRTPQHARLTAALSRAGCASPDPRVPCPAAARRVRARGGAGVQRRPALERAGGVCVYGGLRAPARRRQAAALHAVGTSTARSLLLAALLLVRGSRCGSSTR